LGFTSNVYLSLIQNQNQNNSIEMSKNKIGIQVWSKCKQWIELQAMNHSATQGYLQTEKEMNCILENHHFKLFWIQK